MKRSIFVAAAFATSLAAVGIVVGIGLTEHPGSIRSAPRAAVLEWPNGPHDRPHLACPEGSSGAIYDGSGLSSIRDPKDAVVEVLPDVSDGDPWPADIVAGLSRDDLDQVWYTRDEMGGHAAIVLSVDGSYYALYDVDRWLIAAGEPIRWRDSGWRVGDSTVCQFPRSA